MSDDREDLALFVVDRDERAFERLVERYWGLVWATCKRSGAEEPGDAAQAVFLVLATRARHLTKRNDLVGFLYETARRVSWQQRRSNLARRQREQTAANSGVADMTDPDLNDTIHAALDRLSKVDRSAILLRHVQDLSEAEVGQRLGVSANAAAARLSRARAKLRRILGDADFSGLEAGVLSTTALVVTAAPLPAIGEQASLITAGTQPVGPAYALAQHTAKAMAFAKMKAAAAVSAATLFLGAGLALAVLSLVDVGKPVRADELSATHPVPDQAADSAKSPDDEHPVADPGSVSGKEIEAEWACWTRGGRRFVSAHSPDHAWPVHGKRGETPRSIRIDSYDPDSGRTESLGELSLRDPRPHAGSEAPRYWSPRLLAAGVQWQLFGNDSGESPGCLIVRYREEGADPAISMSWQQELIPTTAIPLRGLQRIPGAAVDGRIAVMDLDRRTVIELDPVVTDSGLTTGLEEHEVDAELSTGSSKSVWVGGYLYFLTGTTWTQVIPSTAKPYTVELIGDEAGSEDLGDGEIIGQSGPYLQQRMVFAELPGRGVYRWVADESGRPKTAWRLWNHSRLPDFAAVAAAGGNDHGSSSRHWRRHFSLFCQNNRLMNLNLDHEGLTIASACWICPGGRGSTSRLDFGERTDDLRRELQERLKRPVKTEHGVRVLWAGLSRCLIAHTATTISDGHWQPTEAELEFILIDTRKDPADAMSIIDKGGHYRESGEYDRQLGPEWQIRTCIDAADRVAVKCGMSRWLVFKLNDQTQRSAEE